MRLETERLILRPWEHRDRAPLAAIMADEAVRRYYPSRLTVEQTNAQIDYAIEQTRLNGFHMQAAELKEDGSLVGWIGIGHIPALTREAIPGQPPVEIGWLIDRRFWGRGLAPEAARACLAHGWSLGLEEIVAFTSTDNLPSQRVMQKIGMTRDPARDFDHPRIPEGHPLRRLVLYRITSPAAPSRSGTSRSAQQT